MKYINLIDKLTESEKATIKAYVNKFGCPEKDFVGVEEWLQNWSHANQKLYKLLGNKFIYEFPFSYEKNKAELKKDLEDLIYDDNGFRCNFSNFISWLWDNEEDLNMSGEEIRAISRCFSLNSLIENSIPIGLKYKKPDGKKMLQLQEGTKPLRAINQIMNYFSDYEWNKDSFEKFRKAHAIIFSEKMVKGNACISIHPLDFMSMSDNDSNWSSCMSWKNDGCYHIGTVEMMNSNNVVCCYLKNDNPFVFDKDTINSETGEIIGVWNNKRWRQLFYVTKDIIMSGKPYPYVTLDLTNKLLDEVKGLAESNLNWHYTFGPEKYNDMEHVTSLSRMEKQREWIHAKSFKKHNILWDTKGMYNDMLNDINTTYMCYRNKVNHTKIISVSGKANCLCCNKDVLFYNEYAEEYNDRYNDTGNVICDECIEEKFTCSWCREKHTTDTLIKSEKNGFICPDCLKRNMKICPCCGKIMYIRERMSSVFTNPYLYKILSTKEGMDYTLNKFEQGDISIFNVMHGYTKEEVEDNLRYNIENKDEDKDFGCLQLEGLYCCQECTDKIKQELKKDKDTYKFLRKSWWGDRTTAYYIINPKKAEKYRYHNLQNVSPEKYISELIES